MMWIEYLRIARKVLWSHRFRSALTVLKTGFISADRIAAATIGGDVIAGMNGGTALVDSGAIRATREIASLIIKGNVLGNSDVRSVISAGGLGSDHLAVTRLVIHGRAEHLDVLGGYSGDAAAGSPLGGASNPDALSGTIVFRSSVLATNVVSGAVAGSDGRFGTSDDRAIGSGVGADNPNVLSRIAKVVIRGAVQPNPIVFGIVAQSVDAVEVGGVPVELHPNPGVDSLEIGPVGSNLRVNEIGR